MTQPRVTQRRVDIDGYPTQCCRCGQPIVKKRHDSQQHYDHHTRTATSWHTTCTTFAAPADVKQRHPAPAVSPSAGASAAYHQPPNTNRSSP